MTAKNKKIIQAFYEDFFNPHRLDLLEQFVAQDVQNHAPFDPSLPQGIEGLRQGFAITFEVTPDVQVTVEKLICEGDTVVSRETMTGTFLNPMMGLQPTGKSFKVNAINIFRLKDGKIVERWGNFDELGMLKQMGVVPE